jgi:hypothetical protein
MISLENFLDKLKPKAIELQNKINNSGNEGWTVLDELTEKLAALNEEIDKKELQWLELAEEELESAEAEELV